MSAKLKKFIVFGVMLSGLQTGTAAITAPGPADIRDVLTQSTIVGADQAWLQSFYSERQFSPAWSDEAARLLQAVMARAEEEGLDPSSYVIPATGPTAVRDILLTRAALDYARDLRTGRAAMRTRDVDVDLPPVAFDPVAELQTALQAQRLSNFLQGLPPSQPGYRSLKKALAFYRDIAAKGGWPMLGAGEIDPAGHGAAVDALHDRLTMEYPALRDLELRDLVKRFQADHGLAVSGRVSGKTLAELNRPVTDRIEQIAANMERWRWMPSQFEHDFISVNVPNASLSLVLQDRLVLESRVVVGKPASPTPILRAPAAGITVNPPWNIPASIARHEILPKLKTNPAYLQQQDMVLLDGPVGDPHGLHVPWGRIPAGTFPFRIQQHPGSKNALGTIKLELPNRFDVYLHDTPSKNAFNLPARDVSHGCVRVEAILPLASYVLSENLASMIQITDAVAAGTTKYLPLKAKVPVYFLYWTTFTDKNGNLQFRPDIYGRDQRLIALQRKMQPLRAAAASIGCQRG